MSIISTVRPTVFSPTTHRRECQPSSPVPVSAPAQDRNGAVAARIVEPEPPRSVRRTPGLPPGSNRRALAFRCVRLLFLGGLAYVTCVYALGTFVFVESRHAQINGEIMALRAPIDGRITLERRTAGTAWPAGTVVFQVENVRIGSVLAQLNSATELVERLTIESEEAALRYRQQEVVFRTHERMFAEGIISRLLFSDELTRFDLARTAMSNKVSQLTAAKARAREMEEQVALQREAVVRIPFNGVAWSIAAQDGQVVQEHETVMEIVNRDRIWVDAIFHERHARSISAGTTVTIRTVDGNKSWPGVIENVRAGIGRISNGNKAVSAPLDFSKRQVAVRVVMESANPFDAAEFYGIGRSVVVSLDRSDSTARIAGLK